MTTSVVRILRRFVVVDDDDDDDDDDEGDAGGSGEATNIFSLVTYSDTRRPFFAVLLAFVDDSLPLLTLAVGVGW